jgi:hypothetical protein
MTRNRTNRRGRRGDGSISERTRVDGTVVYDTYWHHADPVTGKSKRACKRGFPTERDAAWHLKTQTAAAEAGARAGIVARQTSAIPIEGPRDE